MMAHSILIVDDDVDTRSLLGASLTEHGFIVYAARNGRHALQILERLELANGLVPGWTLSKCSPSPWMSRRSWHS